jgi:hypothetical protein
MTRRTHGPQQRAHSPLLAAGIFNHFTNLIFNLMFSQNWQYGSEVEFPRWEFLTASRERFQYPTIAGFGMGSDFLRKINSEIGWNCATRLLEDRIGEFEVTAMNQAVQRPVGY